jgi:hypothetical protein
MTTMRPYTKKGTQKPGPQFKRPADKAKHWNQLMDKAIAAADKIDDKRVADLRRGIKDPERTLRRLHIISEADIMREFPA